MHGIDVIARLQQHRIWANSKLLETASQLSEQQLRESFAIGQGSVWKSLVHMFGAEYVWCEAFYGNECGVAPGDVAGKLPGNQLGEHPIASIGELQSRWSELNERWNSAIGTLDDASLDDMVYRMNSLTGRRAKTKRIDVLLHLNMHAHYTTAQVLNMFRQLDVQQLPDPMLITMARQEQV
jgi:uncharacterized damage-inducible protein DinB